MVISVEYIEKRLLIGHLGLHREKERTKIALWKLAFDQIGFSPIMAFVHLSCIRGLDNALDRGLYG